MNENAAPLSGLTETLKSRDMKLFINIELVDCFYFFFPAILLFYVLASVLKLALLQPELHVFAAARKRTLSRKQISYEIMDFIISGIVSLLLVTISGLLVVLFLN